MHPVVNPHSWTQCIHNWLSILRAQLACCTVWSHYTHWDCFLDCFSRFLLFVRKIQVHSTSFKGLIDSMIFLRKFTTGVKSKSVTVQLRWSYCSMTIHWMCLERSPNLAKTLHHPNDITTMLSYTGICKTTEALNLKDWNCFNTRKQILRVQESCLWSHGQSQPSPAHIS